MRKIGLFFPYLRGSGICRVPAIHSVAFVQAGYEVDVIVRDGNAVFEYAGKLINLNVKPRRGVGKLITYIELYIKILKVKKNNYDFFISHTPHCDFINIITKNQEKVITTVHVNISKKYSKVARLLLRVILKNSDTVVTVSKYIANNLQNRFPEYSSKVVCIYNPVDFQEIIEMSREEISAALPPEYIISAGRLATQKGQWHLIKAFSKISNEFPQLELVFIGEGELENQLKQLVHDLKISSKVKFMGFQKNPYKYMKSAKLLVLTSLYEGFPMVGIEAMATETPLLATDFKSGAREIIAPEKEIGETIDYNIPFKYGFLLPDFANLDDFHKLELSKGEMMLADALRDIFSRPELLSYYGKRGKERVASLSIEEIMKKWEALFNTIELNRI